MDFAHFGPNALFGPLGLFGSLDLFGPLGRLVRFLVGVQISLKIRKTED